MHRQAARCFARYLLECPPAEPRDLRLAEDLARWTQDVGVRWSPLPKDGRLPAADTFLPYIPAGGRASSHPPVNNRMQAVIHLRLHQATDKALYLAKAQALATPVLVAQEPRTGRLNTGMGNHFDLRTDYYWYGQHGMVSGWTAQLLREYGRIRGEIAAGVK